MLIGHYSYLTKIVHKFIYSIFRLYAVGFWLYLHGYIFLRLPVISGDWNEFRADRCYMEWDRWSVKHNCMYFSNNGSFPKTEKPS